MGTLIRNLKEKFTVHVQGWFKEKTPQTQNSEKTILMNVGFAFSKWKKKLLKMKTLSYNEVLTNWMFKKETLCLKSLKGTQNMCKSWSYFSMDQKIRTTPVGMFLETNEKVITFIRNSLSFLK